MNEQIIIDLIKELQSQNKSDPAVYAAIGVIVGSVLTIIGQLSIEFYKNWKDNKLDKSRMNLLKTLLLDDRYKWRNLDTLSKVIGTQREKTKELLIRIGARGSSSNGFNDMWGLIKRNPLENIDKDK